MFFELVNPEHTAEMSCKTIDFENVDFNVVDEERVLVEMACGAALAAVYSGLVRRLQDEGKRSGVSHLPEASTPPLSPSPAFCLISATS